MGAKDLWMVIKGIERRQSLADAALAKLEVLHSPDPHVQKTAVFGVDISPLMAACIAASNRSKFGQSSGGPLRPFFYALARYLQAPANFVFVFDGPKRPSVKRNKKVLANETPWWNKPSKRLIKEFGFAAFDAPGEAEAELALLNRWGVVDAILTPDCDTLVFGAPVVFRTLPYGDRDQKDEVDVYLATEVMEKKSLTTDRLIFYALARGGDYDTAGIENCGQQSSYSLAISGIGDELIKSVRRAPSEDAAAAAVRDWRRRICDRLQKGTLSIDTRSRNTLLKALRETSFPKIQVIQNYTRPITSRGTAGNSQNWRTVQLPSLSGIATLCQERLDWEDGARLQATFRSHIFEGAVMRLLCAGHCTWEKDTHTFGTSRYRLRIAYCKLMNRQGKRGGSKEPRLGVYVEDLEAWTREAYDHGYGEGEGMDIVGIWVPLALIPQWAFSIQAGPKSESKKNGPSSAKDMSKGKGKSLGTSRGRAKKATKAEYLGVIEIDDCDPEAPTLTARGMSKGKGRACDYEVQCEGLDILESDGDEEVANESSSAAVMEGDTRYETGAWDDDSGFIEIDGDEDTVAGSSRVSGEAVTLTRVNSRGEGSSKSVKAAAPAVTRAGKRKAEGDMAESEPPRSTKRLKAGDVAFEIEILDLTEDC